MIRHLSFSLFFFITLGFTFLQAQDLNVVGTVTSSEKNEPLDGVTVFIKGTETGTVTDKRGTYVITVPSPAGAFFSRPTPAPTLIFSYIGFKSVEVDVEGRLSVDVVLEPEFEDNKELIFTGTAAGLTKKGICFSVGQLEEEFITAVPTSNLGVGLQGKIPGLRVNQVGGQPGQGTFFQLRSANSIANGQQPLIIIDGIYLNGSSLADINVDDIEKVEVLKGSAGASLYGSQAANGVIQIFTKRGRGLEIGDTKVIYRGEFGYSNETNRYEVNQFTNREVVDPNGPQPILGNPSASNIHNIELPNLQDYQEDYFFQKGLFQSNYLAIQSRTQKTNFWASAQRLKDEGIIQFSDGYTRNAFRLNLDHQISNKFDIQISSMYSNSQQDLLANGQGSYLATLLSLTPIFDLDVPNEEDASPYDWDIDNTGQGVANPLYEHTNNHQTVNRNRLLGNIKINYTPRKWLTLSYSATMDRSINEFEQFLNKGYLSTNVPGVFGNLATADLQGGVNGGGIHRSRKSNNYYTSRIDAIAKKSLGKFNTAFRGSFLYENLTQTYNEGIGENLAVDHLRSLDNAQSNISIASDEQQVVANSAFLIGDIDYKQKYIFSSLFRTEGSSLFGAEERWSNYYRLSGAYRLREDIKIKGFQELKLTASIGTAGIRPQFEQRFETFELINGTVTKKTLGNSFLRPAKSTEMEIGVHATFLKAFDLEFNYSEVKTEDQILLVPLSGAAGFSGQWKNAGALEATVYEGSLNINLKRLFKIKAKDFSWDVLATFDRVEQKVSQLDVPAYNTGPGTQSSSLFLIEEGLALGTMVGEVFVTHIDQLAEQETINPTEYTFNDAGYLVRQDQLGTPNEVPYKLMDENGNPVIQQIGDINPDFRMGFSHTLRFKGLRLYTLFDWKKGGDIYNMSKQLLYGQRRHTDLSAYENIANSFYGNDGLYNGLVANNHFVEDGSFVMLREASLSYTFKEQQLKHLFKGLIENIRLSLTGRNLFTMTDYSGLHPDVSSLPMDENRLTNRVQGALGSDDRTPNGDPSLFMVDMFNYPLRRTFTFSLQATF